MRISFEDSNIFAPEACSGSDVYEVAYFFGNMLVEYDDWFTDDGYSFYRDKEVFEEYEESLR